MGPGEAGLVCGIQSSGTILTPKQDQSQAVFRNTSSRQLCEPGTEEPTECSRREAGLRLQMASEEDIDGVCRVPTDTRLHQELVSATAFSCFPRQRLKHSRLATYMIQHSMVLKSLVAVTCAPAVPRLSRRRPNLQGECAPCRKDWQAHLSE